MNSIDRHVASIRDVLPATDALLSRYGNTRLRDYVEQLGQPSAVGLQSNQDFIAEIGSYTRETLGSELEQEIVGDLREQPQVLTVNHHGIDTFAQSTQSNLLFSMRRRGNGSPFRTVPVLACGSVPLNNLTYPRGFLIYATAAALSGGVCKLPLFPDSYKKRLVNVVQSFTAEMLLRSRNRAKKLLQDEAIHPSMESALNLVFDDMQRIDANLLDYSSQATVVNNRIWQHLFRGGFQPPELVYIDLEKIAARLLRKDLFDKSTICHQLMFDPALRKKLIENLDGKRGCWQYEKLLQQCTDIDHSDGLSESGSSAGTMFFWGVDAKGRQIPLCVVEHADETKVELRGKDGKGQSWSIPFTPAGINQALQNGILLPSIFTSYLLISIARGISCIGGYYQAEYLPVMKAAVIDTLAVAAGGGAETGNLEQSGPDLYLSGMQSVGIQSEQQLRPAGPLEIIASGGFDAEQYQQLGDLTVLQSHIASLYDTITDVFPDSSDPSRNESEIAKLVYQSVGDKLVDIAIN